MGNNVAEKGTITLGQKEYTLVAKRVEDFREKHPDFFLGCVDLRLEENGVFAKSELRDADGKVLAIGHGMITDNRAFKVERAETKANGRSLAFFGFGGSDFSIASAEEMEDAAAAEKELAEVERLISHNHAVRENIESIVAIKTYLANDQYENAYECIREMDNDDWQACWRATSRGGIWTTKERAQLKSNEMNEARKAFHNHSEDDDDVPA